MKKKYITGIIIILIGIFIITIPYRSDIKIKKNTEEVKNIIEDISYESMKKNQEKENEYNFDLIEDVDISKVKNNNEDMNKELAENVIGLLTVNNTKIKNLPIYNGINHDNLMSGASTMKAKQEMGKGNYSLAGHYMKNPNLLFGDLMNVDIGDTVEITNKEKIYIYKIYNKEVVNDDRVDLIEDKVAEDRGNPIISLMTCNYTSKYGERFFTYGDLIDIKDF